MVASIEEITSESDRRVVACLMEMLPNALARCRIDFDGELAVTMKGEAEMQVVWRAFRLVYGDEVPDFEDW